jgi:hypothetical protein
VIADVSWTLGNPTPHHLLTDATWKLSTTDVPGWQDLTFNDSAWMSAVALGPNGTAPWGPILGASTAQWLWSYVPSADAASKPVSEDVWVRKAFYVSPSGDPVTTPGTPCP